MLSAVGLIMTWPGVLVPKWALLCDGSEVGAGDYPELWQVMAAGWQASYDTFYLPDLMNRGVVGSGDEYEMAEKVGAKTHTITVAQLPSHTHTNRRASNLAIPIGPLAPVTVKIPSPYTDPDSGATGGDGDIPLVQPSQALMYIIVSGRSA